MLLSLYLREHHKLSLPGIGLFHYSGTISATEADASTAANIQFERKTVIEPEEALIEFIKQKTGKIRPLAIADLSSYLESGLQLLNIGKPFYIEGIGTIQRTKEGYDFAPREIQASKLEEPISDRSANTDKKQHSKSVFDDEKYTPGVNPWQKIMVAVLILGGLAIVVFGGYYLYNQNNNDASLLDDSVPAHPHDTISIKQDTLNTPVQDSLQTMATYAANTTDPGTYKFILETTNSKKRALKRYTQLKWTTLKMETVDSSTYKLYFVIPATAKDTARIKDSLNRYYTSKVKIEL